MKKIVSFDVILAAGGSGQRFGGSGNKVLALWQGRPLLWYSLNLFGTYPGVERVVIPHRPQDRLPLEKLVADWRQERGTATPMLILTEGGRERQESVYKALACCRAEKVLIHDGARPFATADIISACLAALETYPAATAGVLSKDTIKIVNEKKEAVSTTDRSRTYIIQTPQGFQRELLWQAHKAYQDVAVTDDCALMERAGYPVKITAGSYENIKVTTPEDLPGVSFGNPV